VIRTIKKLTNGYVGPTRDIMKPEGVPYIQGIHITDVPSKISAPVDGKWMKKFINSYVNAVFS
jgi:hypothetical protein